MKVSSIFDSFLSKGLLSTIIPKLGQSNDVYLLAATVELCYLVYARHFFLVLRNYDSCTIDDRNDFAYARIDWGTP